MCLLFIVFYKLFFTIVYEFIVDTIILTYHKIIEIQLLERYLQCSTLPPTTDPEVASMNLREDSEKIAWMHMLMLVCTFCNLTSKNI